METWCFSIPVPYPCKAEITARNLKQYLETS